MMSYTDANGRVLMHFVVITPFHKFVNGFPVQNWCFRELRMVFITLLVGTAFRIYILQRNTHCFNRILIVTADVIYCSLSNQQFGNKPANGLGVQHKQTNVKSLVSGVRYNGNVL
jgi:hypothetical protein